MSPIDVFSIVVSGAAGIGAALFLFALLFVEKRTPGKRTPSWGIKLPW